MVEIRRNNLRSFRNTSTQNVAERKSNNSLMLHDIPGPSNEGCSCSNININVIYDNCDDKRGSDDEYFSSSSSLSISEFSDAFASSWNSLSEPSFRERLASCFVNNNITHVQGNSILSVLRSSLFFYFTKEC